MKTIFFNGFPGEKACIETLALLWSCPTTKHLFLALLSYNGYYLRAGVIPLAHTPLAKGLATGVYTASNPTGGATGLPKYNFEDLMPLSPIHTALVEVGGTHRKNSFSRREGKGGGREGH